MNRSLFETEFSKWPEKAQIEAEAGFIHDGAEFLDSGPLVDAFRAACQRARLLVDDCAGPDVWPYPPERYLSHESKIFSAVVSGGYGYADTEPEWPLTLETPAGTAHRVWTNYQGESDLVCPACGESRETSCAVCKGDYLTAPVLFVAVYTINATDESEG